VGRHLSRDEADELETCFRAHAKALFAYGCMITRNDQALADDLVQETFQAAAEDWLSLSSLGEGKRVAWLRVTMRNLAVSRFRHNEMTRRMQPVIEQRYRGPVPDTPRDALNALTLERCWQAITDMPERQHMVALMYWHLGLPQSEIAELLGIAPSTVAVHIHNARKKLLATLEERPPLLNEGLEIDGVVPHAVREVRRHGHELRER
jgi:RNA polymerase sigma-70 factor (ECF subfamily)